jgi:hypothetical protein
MKTLVLFVGAIALISTQKASAQRAFDTPEAAAQALIDAAGKNDTAQLAEIFGPQGKSLLTSGNAEQDKAEREQFASIAKGKHELQKDSMNSDRMILSIGSEDWPYPVPLVRTNGKWMFDSSMGEMSMKARRIGANELDAIEVCAGFVGTQEEYAKQHGTHFASNVQSLGSLVPKEFIAATGAHPKPYRGYHYSMLKAPSGFALVAWPADYGISGVHSFMIGTDGVVYEKDMGPPHKLAPPVARFDPDKTWAPVN